MYWGLGMALYLLIDGLNGGSTDPDHLGWFEIDSASISSSAAVLSGDLDDADFSELVVSLLGLSPDILTALLAGTSISSIRVQNVDGAGNLIYDILLGDVLVTSNSFSAGGNAPFSSLSFSYTQFAITTPDSSFGFDIDLDTEIAPTSITAPSVGSTDGLEDGDVVQYYMVIDGYNGGSTVVGHEGAFELLSVQGGVGVAPNSGVPVFSEIGVTLEGLAAALFEEATAADRLSAVRIEGVNAAGETVYEMRLEDVFLTANSVSTGPSGAPFTSLSLNYQQFGLITADDSVGFDIQSQVAIDATTLPIATPDAIVDVEAEDVVDYFLTIDSSENGTGGKAYIEIDIDSINFSASSAASFITDDKSAVAFSDISVSFDGISADLMAFVGSGNTLGAVRLTGVNSSGEVVYDIRLDDAFVSSNQIGGSEGGTVTTELSISYGDFGLVTDPGDFGFDVDNQLALDPGTIATPVATVADLASYEITHYYMAIDGLGGGTEYDGSKGWFEINSLSFGGTSVGVASFSEVSVDMDGITPALFAELAAGGALGAVQIVGVDSKGAVVYELKLSDAMLSGNSAAGAGGSVATSLSFEFAQVGLITPDGNFGFDVSSNLLVNPTAIADATPVSTNMVEDGAIEQ